MGKGLTYVTPSVGRPLVRAYFFLKRCPHRPVTTRSNIVGAGKRLAGEAEGLARPITLHGFTACGVKLVDDSVNMHYPGPQPSSQKLRIKGGRGIFHPVGRVRGMATRSSPLTAEGKNQAQIRGILCP